MCYNRFSNSELVGFACSRVNRLVYTIELQIIVLTGYTIFTTYSNPNFSSGKLTLRYDMK